MRARLVLAQVAGEDGWECPPDPHPHLVLPQRPTPSQLAEAVAVVGAFPDGSYLAGELRISVLTV